VLIFSICFRFPFYTISEFFLEAKGETHLVFDAGLVVAPILIEKGFIIENGRIVPSWKAFVGFIIPKVDICPEYPLELRLSTGCSGLISFSIDAILVTGIVDASFVVSPIVPV
jgi:hypothetical protein